MFVSSYFNFFPPLARRRELIRLFREQSVPRPRRASGLLYLTNLPPPMCADLPRPPFPRRFDPRSRLFFPLYITVALSGWLCSVSGGFFWPPTFPLPPCRLSPPVNRCKKAPNVFLANFSIAFPPGTFKGAPTAFGWSVRGGRPPFFPSLR